MDSSWLSQMRKGVLELCVLAIVDREETYGYAVVERMGKTPGMEVTESTVYPLLARLSNDGLLKLRIEKSSSGPPRRYYSLSALGKKRLRELANTWATIVGSVASLIEPSLATSAN
jgi:PadR family transcriptional regulator, regulatory protein PadR